MNSISEALLKSIDKIITTQIDAKNKSDKTVKATIVEPISLNDGKYMVKYQGGTFIAYDNNKKGYKTDELVYVKIPEGDLSNKKVIEGPVVEQTLAQYEENKNKFEKYSPNLLRNLITKPYDLTLTENTTNKTWSLRTNYVITFDSGENWDEFYQGMKTYASMMLSADFQTKNFYDGYAGNYGIKIDFYKSNETVPTLSQKLDIENFNGSVYNFGIPANQFIHFESKNFDCFKVVITLFAENLKFKSTIPENRIPTITISNIGLYFTSPAGLDVPYIIDTKQDKVVDSIEVDGDSVSRSKTTVVPSLFWGGKEIVSNIKWSWYELSPGKISVGDEGYNAAAGKDWVPITITAKDIEYEQSKNSNYSVPDIYKEGNNLIVYSLEQDKNWKKKYFKAIATIGANEDHSSKEIIVVNEYQNQINFVFSALNQEFTFIAKDTSKAKDNNITSQYSLYYEFNENKNLNSGENRITTKDEKLIWNIPIQVFNNYQSREFTYFVYKDDEFIEKGSLYYINETFSQYNQAGTLPVVGTNVFLYGANGVLKSATDEFSLTIPEEVQINGKMLKVKNIKWFWKNGTVALDSERRTISNSMVNSAYGVKDNDNFYNKITFKIGKTFQQSWARDNYFTITYTLNDKLYNQVHYLQFLTEGQMGTNGTGWVGFIDERGNKNVLSYYAPGEIKTLDEVIFSVNVLKDGTKAEAKDVNNTQSNYSYHLTIEKSVNCFAEVAYLQQKISNVVQAQYGDQSFEQVLDDYKEQVIRVKPHDPNDKTKSFKDWDPSKPTYFQVKIECYNGKNENGEARREYELFLYCPIITSNPLYSKIDNFGAPIAGAAEIARVNIIKSNIPDNIVYNSNGFGSNWSASTAITVSDNKFNIDKEKCQRINITNQGNIDPIDYGVLLEESKDNNTEIIPNALLAYSKEIKNGQGKSLGNIYFYKTIIFSLNRFGNEAINGWDGQSISINEAGKYILAPTLGAGTKYDSVKDENGTIHTNVFSGVIMGVDSEEKKTGIYGYRFGRKTFSISEDGKAEFEGKVTAGEGEIAGWTIDKVWLENRKTSLVTVNNKKYYYRPFIKAPKEVEGGENGVFGIRRFDENNNWISNPVNINAMGDAHLSNIILLDNTKEAMPTLGYINAITSAIANGFSGTGLGMRSGKMRLGLWDEEEKFTVSNSGSYTSGGISGLEISLKKDFEFFRFSTGQTTLLANQSEFSVNLDTPYKIGISEISGISFELLPYPSAELVYNDDSSSDQDNFIAWKLPSLEISYKADDDESIVGINHRGIYSFTYRNGTIQKVRRTMFTKLPDATS